MYHTFNSSTGISPSPEFYVILERDQLCRYLTHLRDSLSNSLATLKLSHSNDAVTQKKLCVPISVRYILVYSCTAGELASVFVNRSGFVLIIKDDFGLVCYKKKKFLSGPRNAIFLICAPCLG